MVKQQQQQQQLRLFLIIVLLSPCVWATAELHSLIRSSIDIQVVMPSATNDTTTTVVEDLENFSRGYVDGRRKRRSAYWRRRGYYISYRALTADRIPCPPLSGRSYYSPNCLHLSSPVNPYVRGCAAITRCRS